MLHPLFIPANLLLMGSVYMVGTSCPAPRTMDHQATALEYG